MPQTKRKSNSVSQSKSKIKLIIFDLDGVLIDSRMIHYYSLNDALPEPYKISIEEHLSTYDGLSTTKKLLLLHEKKGLPKHLFDEIWKEKQSKTLYYYEEKIKYDLEKVIAFRRIMRETGAKIACASNSIRETMEIALKKTGLFSFFEKIVSNEDVIRPKPYPDMYWKIITDCNVLPKETLIVEDSHIGREAVLNSGAHLLAVQDSEDWTAETILKEIKKLNGEQEKTNNIPWIDKKLNVVIPMAGRGSRFTQAGYTFPKPLIEVLGKPMIQLVVENLNIEANYIFIVQKEHYEKYSLGPFLQILRPGCKIVQTDEITEGAACTVLLAKEHINNDDPVLLVNSDQYIEWNSNQCMYAFNADSVDGGILTFKASHPKWSYAKIDETTGFVSEVAEKNPISDNATVGVYFWKKGSDFVTSAEQMIANDTRVNGEFYIAPVFNEAIAAEKKVRIKEISKMWGLGTPEDLKYFLENYKDESK